MTLPPHGDTVTPTNMAKKIHGVVTLREELVDSSLYYAIKGTFYTEYWCLSLVLSHKFINRTPQCSVSAC